MRRSVLHHLNNCFLIFARVRVSDARDQDLSSGQRKGYTDKKRKSKLPCKRAAYNKCHVTIQTQIDDHNIAIPVDFLSV